MSLVIVLPALRRGSNDMQHAHGQEFGEKLQKAAAESPSGAVSEQKRAFPFDFLLHVAPRVQVFTEVRAATRR